MRSSRKSWADLRSSMGLVVNLGMAIGVAGLTGCASTPSNESQSMIVVPGETGAILYAGLDTFGKSITTDSDEAQRWFDQGMQLLYGFNHDEAVRSFKEAAARDPKAAMPWWGVAYASGMNINDAAMTDAKWKTAHNAAQHAIALLDNESEVERALVEAVAQRYTWPAPAEQRPYDEAYAAAMKKVYDRYGNDPDIAAFYAESLMDLQPWDYWTTDAERAPKGNTTEIVAAIERALAADPNHPGASHYYIHAMEAGPAPEKAVPYADRLLKRIPGAGHLVHMPSHIYARVGRYADAADANVLAVAADKAYLKVAPPPAMYMIYYAHNQHFLAFASMMEGQYEPAIRAARELERDVPDEVLADLAWLIEGIMPTTYHVLIRFGKWEEILEEPLRPDYRLVSRAVHYYARALAFSALDRPSEARAEIEKFEAAVQAVPEDWFVFNNRMHDVLPIARGMLEGELAFREGRLDDAWAALEAAIVAEDKLIYDEPPAWMLPVRHAMGALLMSAGEFERAETLYRQDQLQHRGNGWSLLGLQQALTAQGNDAEAAELAPLIGVAFARVEQRPTSSCFCEPGGE